MSELQKLRDEFEAKKKKLQETCPHPSKSEWMDYQWAIAHSTGNCVRTCTRCGKILETKSHKELKKEMPNEELPEFLLPNKVRIEIFKLMNTKKGKKTWKEARESYFVHKENQTKTRR